MQEMNGGTLSAAVFFELPNGRAEAISVWTC
jgi:hypothetical protein